MYLNIRDRKKQLCRLKQGLCEVQYMHKYKGENMNSYIK